MRISLENFRYTFTPLTPIHIGSGQELLPYEYIIKNGKYYRIDPMEIFENLSSTEQTNFNKEIEKGMIPFRNYLRKIYKEEYGYIYSGDVEKMFETQYEKKIAGAKRPNEESQLIIKEFVGSMNGKYIPGSSIKGSIRTAFIAETLDGDISYKLGRNERVKTKPFTLLGDEGSFPLKPREVNDKAKEIEAGALGLSRLEPKADPFKFVKVGDTTQSRDLIKVCDVVRASVDPEKSSTPMGAMEVTKSLYSTGDEIELDFNMSFKQLETGILKGLLREIKSEEEIYSDSVLDYLNSKAKKMIESDKEFFKKAKFPNVLKIYENLESILENLEDGAALIRLGQGAGFNSSTLSLYNNRRDEKNDEPRTRVLAEEKFPMGWAILKIKE